MYRFLRDFRPEHPARVTSTKPPRRRRRGLKPGIERMEARLVLSTFVEPAGSPDDASFTIPENPPGDNQYIIDAGTNSATFVLTLPAGITVTLTGQTPGSAYPGFYVDAVNAPDGTDLTPIVVLGGDAGVGVPSESFQTTMAGSYSIATDTGGFENPFTLVVTVPSAPAPAIVPTMPTFSPTDGGVDFGYSIGGANLPRATTVALYWAPDTTFDPSRDTLIQGSVINTGTTVGDYESPHLGPATLGIPPSGTRYLLAVADPGHEYDAPGAVKNSASMDAIPYILWRSLSPTGENTTAFYVKFTPRIGGDNTIKDVEDALGVDHFNWINKVISVPRHWRITLVNSQGRVITRRVELPIIDPTVVPDPSNPPHLRIATTNSRHVGNVGGLPGAGSEDNLPFYWNENPASGEVEANTNPKSFAFYDSPRLPAGFFRKGESEVFETELVGVKKDGSYIDLSQAYGSIGLKFTWETDVTYSKSYFRASGGSIRNIQFH